MNRWMVGWLVIGAAFLGWEIAAAFHSHEPGAQTWSELVWLVFGIKFAPVMDVCLRKLALVAILITVGWHFLGGKLRSWRFVVVLSASLALGAFVLCR